MTRTHSPGIGHPARTLNSLLLGAAFVLAGAGTAQAEADPYYIGVSETLTHESNLVRLADSQRGGPLPAGLVSASDWYATTSLFGGINQPFGRQRFYANVSMKANRFHNNTIYNNTGYSLLAGLDWSTLERVSGNFSVSSNQSLARFDQNITDPATGGALIISTRNIETSDRISAVARVGLVTRLTMEAALDLQRLDYTAAAYRDRESSNNEASLGVVYKPSGQLSLSSGVSFTRGRYPSLLDTYTGHDIYVGATWVPSEISTVDSRLSVGRRAHNTATAKNFSGATGSVVWKWRPTGKITTNMRLNRTTGLDTDVVSVPFGGSTVPLARDDSRLTTTLSLNTVYDLTSKIALDAGLSHVQRSLASNTVTDSDRTNVASLGAHYMPTRTVQLSCNVRRESRSNEFLRLSYPYSANVASCAAQFTLQL